MTHDEAFLQAIRETPFDDAPRLIYADWLEEHGRAERAELIRLQCRLAALPQEDKGRGVLEAARRDAVAAQLGRVGQPAAGNRWS